MTASDYLGASAGGAASPAGGAGSVAGGGVAASPAGAVGPGAAVGAGLVAGVTGTVEELQPMELMQKSAARQQSFFIFLTFEITCRE